MGTRVSPCLEGDAGLELDVTAAAAWLRKAADQGISNAAGAYTRPVFSST
jgi:TPR repeat protein